MNKVNTNRSSKLTLLVLLAMAWILPALAQEDVDVTRELAPDGKVRIENISGSVTVKAWDRSEVHIEGTLGKGADHLDVDGNHRRLKIEVVLPRRSRNVKGSHLLIRMPEGAGLAISTISADIEVSGLAGEISLESVSGRVDVEADPEDFDVQSVSGDLELRVTSKSMELQTVSGDIRLETSSPQNLSIGTISGDVEIMASSVNRFDFESVSGDLDFSGRIDERGRFHSQSGDIYLIFTENPDAEFDIGTFSGDIRNAFGPEAHKSNHFNLSKSLEFTSDEGRASIDIESFSGDIVLKKQ